MRACAMILAVGLLSSAVLAQPRVPLPGKNPGQAVLYSMGFPGLGQVYNEQYKKAAWHAAVGLVGLGMIGASLGDDGGDGGATAGETLSSAKAAQDGVSGGAASSGGSDDDEIDNPGLAAAGVGIYLGMWIYSIIDAKREAEAFNRTRHLGQRLSLEPLALHRGGGAQMRLRF